MSNSVYAITAATDSIQTSPIAVEIAAPETRAFRGAGIVPSERRLRPRRADLVTEWPHVSVIIPTLNEAQNLPHVLAKLPGRLHEVIVVDGFSTDDTLDVARLLRPAAKIVLQQCRGKGDALRCGFEAATGDVLVMLDADGSADPAEIPAFVETLMAGVDFARAHARPVIRQPAGPLAHGQGLLRRRPDRHRRDARPDPRRDRPITQEPCRDLRCRGDRNPSHFGEPAVP